MSQYEYNLEQKRKYEAEVLRETCADTGDNRSYEPFSELDHHLATGTRNTEPIIRMSSLALMEQINQN